MSPSRFRSQPLAPLTPIPESPSSAIFESRDNRSPSRTNFAESKSFSRQRRDTGRTESASIPVAPSRASHDVPRRLEPATPRINGLVIEDVVRSAAANNHLSFHTVTEIDNYDTEAQYQTRRQKTRKWWWQEPGWKCVQNGLITLSIAGMMCLFILSFYVGMLISHKGRLRQEWNVLLVLVLTVTTLFFFHTLIRLFMDLNINLYESRMRRTSDMTEYRDERLGSISSPSGYANPHVPIRINTEFPETISGTKVPPPVYGVWKCTVRVHPEGFFWEKAQGERISEQDPSPPSPTSASLRPPSYVSDDGVSYIVNAIPPSQEDTLPPHPSETGRF